MRTKALQFNYPEALKPRKGGARPFPELPLCHLPRVTRFLVPLKSNLFGSHALLGLDLAGPAFLVKQHAFEILQFFFLVLLFTLELASLSIVLT